MKRIVIKLTITLTLILLITIGTQNVKVVDANPINVYSVPDIQISYPLISTGEYVNSTAEFEVYVYHSTDSKRPSVTYSLDRQPTVSLEFSEEKNCNDLVYVGSKIERMDFKKFTAPLVLEDLSEGTHSLVAYADNMSASISFKVNSYYIIAELGVLSPGSRVYSNTVPLTFTVNGEIESAHYYIYQNRELITDNALSGNTTLYQLSEGDYDLLLFVTTQHGQTSESVTFSVSQSNQLQNFNFMVGAIVLLVLSIVIVLIFVKRRNHLPDK